MKKILFSLMAISLITFAACKKDAFVPNTQATETMYEDADGYTYEDDSNAFDDENEPVELDTRGTDPFSITSVDGDDKATSTNLDGCSTHKWIGLIKPQTAQMTITGVGMGETQGSRTLECFATKDTGHKFLVTVATWSNTSIVFTLGSIPDTLKNFSMKVRLTNPSVRRDSTASNPAKFVTKIKSKTVKCIGSSAGEDMYGSNTWELTKQRALAGKGASIPTSFTAIDTSALGVPNYVPAVGDIVDNSSGKQGVVVAIGTPDSKLRVPVTIWRRNVTCTGSIKKGSWKFKNFFVPKTDGSTWTKFAH